MESKLFLSILNGYVRDARPAKVPGTSVHVSVDMNIMKINELVERDQEIILSGYLKTAWRDERLRWNPVEFGGIEWIVVPSTSIWIPDIGLINVCHCSLFFPFFLSTIPFFNHCLSSQLICIQLHETFASQLWSTFMETSFGFQLVNLQLDANST